MDTTTDIMTIVDTFTTMFSLPIIQDTPTMTDSITVGTLDKDIITTDRMFIIV
jgi:hypothetical protein